MPSEELERDLRELDVEVLFAAFESATEVTIEEVAGRLLAYAISSAIAHPAAAVLGGVARALITKLFDKTKELESRMNEILDEPFQTAVTSLKEVMSVKAHTEEDQYEIQRRLGTVCDRLQSAYTYAEKNAQTRRLTIRSYQVIAAALTKGGRPFMELYLKDLRSAANDLGNRAWAIEANAKQEFGSPEENESNINLAQDELYGIQHRKIERGEYPDSHKGNSASVPDLYDGPLAERALTDMIVSSDRASGRYRSEYDRARLLRSTAKQIEDFCSFAVEVATNRAQIIQNTSSDRN